MTEHSIRSREWWSWFSNRYTILYDMRFGFFFVSTVEHSILVLLWFTRGWIDQANFHYSAFAQIPALQIQYTILKLSELSIRRELLNGLLQQFVCNKPRRALKNLTSISFCCNRVILFWLKTKPKILFFNKGESKNFAIQNKMRNCRLFGMQIPHPLV